MYYWQVCMCDELQLKMMKGVSPCHARAEDQTAFQEQLAINCYINLAGPWYQLRLQMDE